MLKIYIYKHLVLYILYSPGTLECPGRYQYVTVQLLYMYIFVYPNLYTLYCPWILQGLGNCLYIIVYNRLYGYTYISLYSPETCRYFNNGSYRDVLVYAIWHKKIPGPTSNPSLVLENYVRYKKMSPNMPPDIYISIYLFVYIKIHLYRLYIYNYIYISIRQKLTNSAKWRQTTDTSKFQNCE